MRHGFMQIAKQSHMVLSNEIDSDQNGGVAPWESGRVPKYETSDVTNTRIQSWRATDPIRMLSR